MKRLFIFFLLISTVSASEFNVTWTPVKEDIVNKEYLITVQNLKDEMRTVDVESFFEDTNFDTSQVHDVQLIECKRKKFGSKVLKKSKIQKEVSHGKITFPSVKSVGKKNNKGTKMFILKFKTPPTGSYGKVGLKINGKEYHPYWNSTWSNRKKITLTGNTSGSQTGYQLLFNVTYESEMNSDFSDLRFCNDTDQLSAWLESKLNESYALIWVKFPHTPANGETEDYWMYYGNSEVEADWDGETTFEFFDDFEGSSLDTEKWEETGSPDSVTVTNSIVDIYKTADAWGGISSKNSFGSYNIAMKGKIKYDTTHCQAGMSNVMPDMYTNSDTIAFVEWSNTLTYRTRNDGSNTNTAGISEHSNYHIDESTWETGKIKFYRDSILKATHNTNIPDEFMKIGLVVIGRGDTNHIYADWILIRKYTSTEPTYVFGDTEYYVDSIYFNSSNPYYNLIDCEGDITVNHSYYASDDLEWTAAAKNNDTGLIVTSTGTSEIDFSIYESVLDWLHLVNLDDSKTYTLQNDSGDLEEHQASDNTVTFTTDLSPDNYQIEITDTVPPTPTPEPTPITLHDIKMSDKNIKEMYYPFMYILFIIIIIGGFIHVFGN